MKPVIRRREVEILLNGRPMVLPPKENGQPYYVMDLLERSGVDFDQLEAVADERCRLLILSNPSGGERDGVRLQSGGEGPGFHHHPLRAGPLSTGRRVKR